jgi:hypothetical protein
MVITEPRTNTLIYVLDSNAVGGSIVDNAFGSLTRDTLIILRRLEHHFGARPSVYLLHHHVALPPIESTTGLFSMDVLLRRFMVLKNATAFLAALPQNRELVILHGHRHTGFIGRLDNRIEIVSAPSTTLGDENPKPIRGGKGYFTFSIAKTASNGMRISGASWVDI